jgi:hypothetical protein
MRRTLAAVLAISASSACVGTTGSELISFHVYAAGPSDSDPTAALTFRSGTGYEVTLTRAVLHVGAVYLDRVLPVSGAQATSCILPGAYVAQETAGLSVDTLSPRLQPFPDLAEGTETPALAGEVWLTGGDVNAATDPTVIFDVAGTASKDGYVISFSGTITISGNRAETPSDPSLPGSDPICKQRIVSPIRTEITPTGTGYLILRVDPRKIFANVEFLDAWKTLPPPGPLTYSIVDSSLSAENPTQPDRNVYQGLQAAAGVYSFEWVAAD